jgi:hypothetical protein
VDVLNSCQPLPQEVVRNEAFLPQIKASYDLLDSEVRSAAFVHRSDKAASSANPRRLGR